MSSKREHKAKIKKARRMMTSEEKKTKHGRRPDGSKKGKTSLFDSKAWNDREKARLNKMRKQRMNKKYKKFKES